VFSVQRCVDVANLVYKLLLGRTLSALDFGAIEPVFAVLAVVSLPTLIITQVAVKSISRLRSTGRLEECRSIVSHLGWIALTGSVLAVLLVAGLQDFILERLHLESRVFIWLIAGLLVLAWWRPLSSAILQGSLHYRVMFFSAPLQAGLIILFVLIFVAWLDLGLPGALLARVLSGGLSLCVVLIMIRSMVTGPRRHCPDEVRLMAKMFIPMAVYLGSHTLLIQFDRLFVRNFLLSDSGGFGAVVTFGSIPYYLVGPVIYVLFPLAAASHAQGHDVKKPMAQATVGALAVTVLGCGGLAAAAPTLMRFLNPEFVRYAPYLWIYALTMGLHSAVQIVASVELARHRYSFLWFMALPAVTMCVLLYSQRGSWRLQHVVWAGAITRAIVLVCMVIWDRLSEWYSGQR
jgi:O-antigen/teichoic acid export membrane protein